MKYATYQIEDTTVEFYNSLLGKEALYVNGKITSEKYSVWGTEHYFKIGENNYSIRPYLNISAPWGIAFKLHKNGLPLDSFTVLEKKNISNYIAVILFSLIAGLAFGYYATKLFF